MTRPGLVGIFNHVQVESPLDDGDRTHPSVCLRCVAWRFRGAAAGGAFVPPFCARPMELHHGVHVHSRPCDVALSRLLLQA